MWNLRNSDGLPSPKRWLAPNEFRYREIKQLIPLQTAVLRQQICGAGSPVTTSLLLFKFQKRFFLSQAKLFVEHMSVWWPNWQTFCLLQSKLVVEHLSVWWPNWQTFCLSQAKLFVEHLSVWWPNWQTLCLTSNVCQTKKHCLTNIINFVWQVCWAFGYHDKHCLTSTFCLLMSLRLFRNIFACHKQKMLSSRCLCKGIRKPLDWE